MMKKVYRYFRLLLQYKGTAVDLIALSWRLLLKVVNSFSFRKLDINANVGMSKPDNMGYTVGAVEAAKQLLKNKKVLIKIKPDYCHDNYLYGEMEFSASFHIFRFVKNMLMLCYEALWKKNIRKTIWRFASKFIKDLWNSK